MEVMQQANKKTIIYKKIEREFYQPRKILDSISSNANPYFDLI